MHSELNTHLKVDAVNKMDSVDYMLYKWSMIITVECMDLILVMCVGCTSVFSVSERRINFCLVCVTVD